MPVPDDLHTADGSGLLGWEAVDLPMLLLLPLLLVLSGFFSGSETALFGLTETDRMKLRRDGSFAGRAVEALLGNERMLLITLLLGNMTINVLYFVISSVLLMRAEAGVIGSLALAAGSLLLLILLGEVLPKQLANSRRTAMAALVATPLVAIHQVIAPVRLVLDRGIVGPLSRLTAPGEAPPRLDREELVALVEVSGREGVIDDHEQRILQDVISLSQRKARDVMTPRVRMAALPVDASYEQVRALVAETRLTKFPVYRQDLDRIVGLLHAKSYLLAASDDGTRQHPSLEALATPVPFVPEMATLDQLLAHFRRTHTQLAIAVDEFGGTAGLVALEDVVEELVGDIASVPEREQEAPQAMGPNRWRVGGDASVHAWARAFGRRLIPPRVATLGGLIVSHLGRAPRVGDAVELGNVRLEVEAVDRARVVTAIVTLRADSIDGGEADP